jgi:hypothetical protein
MYETLAPLVERAMSGSMRPLEFYLREQSRLPGTRANLELVNELTHLLAALVAEQPESVQELLCYLMSDERQRIVSNTPAEFVILCGIVAMGQCSAAHPKWWGETFELLGKHACSPLWRVREGVALAFQRLLPVATRETVNYLMILATQGNYFQQRAAIAAIAEPGLLHTPNLVNAALEIQHVILERIHATLVTERKREDFRSLRQASGYTVSVVTAAAPERGFALMRECAAWSDPDITWILRENLKKKRLAKFVEYTEGLQRLLA